SISSGRHFRTDTNRTIRTSPATDPRQQTKPNRRAAAGVVASMTFEIRRYRRRSRTRDPSQFLPRARATVSGSNRLQNQHSRRVQDSDSLGNRERRTYTTYRTMRRDAHPIEKILQEVRQVSPEQKKELLQRIEQELDQSREVLSADQQREHWQRWIDAGSQRP